MVRLALSGLALGVVTSIPVGVANLAVVDAARRVSLRRGAGIAIGAAFADGVHALAACAGVAPLIAERPAIALTLSVVAAVLLVGYGIALLRAPAAASPEAAPRAPGSAPLIGGVAIGLVLTLTNPAALAAWVAVAGALFPGVSIAGGAVVAGGVAIGSAAWFLSLAALAERGNRIYGARAAWVSRGAGIVLLGIGVWLGYRAVRLALALL
jgi:threonine/homoserine/homoserine lactone efflux protein